MPHLQCDPSVCDECMYIGEGDFVCSLHLEEPEKAMVVEDWEPTENYPQCGGHPYE